MSQPWQMQDLNEGGPVKMFDPSQYQPGGEQTAVSAQNTGTSEQQQNGQLYGHQDTNMSAAPTESWNQAWDQANWNDAWNNAGQWNAGPQQQLQPQGNDQMSTQSGQNVEMTAQYQCWNQQPWDQQQAFGQHYAEPNMPTYSEQQGLDSSQGSFSETPSVGSSTSGATGFHQVGNPHAYASQPSDPPQAGTTLFHEVPLNEPPGVNSTQASGSGESEMKPDIPHTNSFSNIPFEPSPFDDIGANSQANTSLNTSSDATGMLSARQLGVPENRDGPQTGDRVKFIIGSQPASGNNSGSQSPYPQTESPGMNASGLNQSTQSQLAQQGPADTGIVYHNSHPTGQKLHPGQVQEDSMRIVPQVTGSLPERPPSTSSCASSHHSSHHSGAAGDSLPGQIPKHEGTAYGTDSLPVESTPPVKHEHAFIDSSTKASDDHQRSVSDQSVRSVDSRGMSESLQSSSGSLQIADTFQDSVNAQNYDIHAPYPPVQGTREESTVMTGPPPASLPMSNFDGNNQIQRPHFEAGEVHLKGQDNQAVQPSVPDHKSIQGNEMQAMPLSSVSNQVIAQTPMEHDTIVGSGSVEASAHINPEQVLTPDDAQPAGPTPQSAAVFSAQPTSPIGAAENVRMVASSPVVSHPGSPFKPPPKFSPPDVDQSTRAEHSVGTTVPHPGSNLPASGPAPVGMSQPAEEPHHNNSATAAGHHMNKLNKQQNHAPGAATNLDPSNSGLPVDQMHHTTAGETPESEKSLSREVNKPSQLKNVQLQNSHQSERPVQNQSFERNMAVPSQINPVQHIQTPANPALQQQLVPPGSQTASNPGHNVQSGILGTPGAPDGQNPRPDAPNGANTLSTLPHQDSSTPQSLSQTSSQLELSSLASATLPTNLIHNTRDAELTSIEQQREQEERNRQDPRYDSGNPRDRRYDDRDRRYGDRDRSYDDRDRRYDDRDRRYDDRDRRYDDRDRRYDDRDRRDDPRHRPSSRGPPVDDRYADPYRPSSRQGYPDDRPSSRQGYPNDRPRSRQGYPEDRYDRPRSRQGYPDDPRYQRPSSRQGYPHDPRARYRDDPYRDRYGRPSSRQGYPGKQISPFEVEINLNYSTVYICVRNVLFSLLCLFE